MGEKIIDKVKELELLFDKYEITAGELAIVRRLREKIENQEITVSVIGQFKRGKSTLVNGILQDKIMPVGIVPVTAVVTSARYGEKAAKVHFNNGAIKDVEFDDVTTYINEQENQDNRLGVAGVEMTLPSEFLKSGITLVDTPGVGSVHQKNSDAAYAFVKESDAVIFMLSVDSPINSIETEFLENAKAFASKFYFAVNKADIVDDDELAEYLAYCKRLICKLMDADDVHLFAVSAKKQLGLEELKTAILTDCRNTTAEIIEESTKLKLRDVVASALRQITLYRTALNMPHDEFDNKFAEMKDFFETVAKEADEFGQQFPKNSAFLVSELNNVKNQLSDKVSELFGIEYHYDIPEVDMAGGAAAGSMNLMEFNSQVKEICEELNETLNVIFMHREENAYKVVRRINDLNRLVRSLVKIRKELGE